MSQNNRQTLSVLMVCLGNICRSPSAEGVMRDRLERAGLADRVTLDSAGTGDWHIGKGPDRRAVAAAAGRGYDIADLRARQVSKDDLDRFDYVIAMDQANLEDLQALAGKNEARRTRVHLLGDFSPAHLGEPVADPYYGGEDGFERVLDMIEECVDGLVEQLKQRLGKQG